MGKTATGFTKRTDGRIMTTFTMDGKRYSVYGKTIKECREKEAKKRQEIAAEEPVKGYEQTLEEYVEQWIEDKRDTVKETTIRNNTMLFKAMAGIEVGKPKRAIKSYKLCDIEKQHIKDVQRSLKARVKTRTVNECISLLRSIFKSAIDDELLQRNPAAGIKPLKRTEERARDNIHRALTKAETAAFLEEAEKSHSFYVDLYLFLLSTGCRIGEAGALAPKDITHGQIRVSRTITRTEFGGYKIGEDTKTEAGRRTIPMNEAARGAIERQRRQQAILSKTEAIPFDKPIFTAPRGSLLKSSVVNEDITRICNRAGIERFTVHAFRDTFATRCVESGMQVKTLQEILGHTDINMTMALYAHAMDETKTEQMNAVNFF